MGILGAPVLVLRMVYLRILLGRVCAPTSSLTGTSNGISLEGEVTSSHVVAFGFLAFASVSVALSALLEGLVSSWLREDASASSVSLDDVTWTASTPSLLFVGLVFFLTLWVWTPLGWFPQHCQQKSRAILNLVLP